jgi:hypothetical protein
LKSFFATLEMGRSGFLASSEINVVEEVQRSRACCETIVDVDEGAILYPILGRQRHHCIVITLTLDWVPSDDPVTPPIQ